MLSIDFKVLVITVPNVHTEFVRLAYLTVKREIRLSITRGKGFILKDPDHVNMYGSKVWHNIINNTIHKLSRKVDLRLCTYALVRTKSKCVGLRISYLGSSIMLTVINRGVSAMRIAIVCSYYPWPPSVGGVETIVRNVSIKLARRGHEVHVITTPFDVTTMKQVSDYGVEERNGVIIHKLKPGGIRIGYARVLKGLKEAIERIRPEIVHSHNLHPHLFQLAIWKKLLR